MRRSTGTGWSIATTGISGGNCRGRSRRRPIGGKVELDLSLRLAAPDRYALEAGARDEFGLSCRIVATLPLFTIGASDFTLERSKAIGAWLDRTFDRDRLDVEWRQAGPASRPWRILEARFRGTG